MNLSLKASFYLGRKIRKLAQGEQMKKTIVFSLLLILLVSVCLAQDIKESVLKSYSNDLYSFKYDPSVWSFAEEGDESRTVTLKRI